MTQNSNLEGYCFKCKEKRIMVDPSPEWSATGSPGTRGTCPVCGGTIYRMGHTDAHDMLEKPVITEKPKKKSSKKKGKKASGSGKARRSGRLVVVESPAKARTIGRYLGRGYTVKSSVGHVRDLLKSRLSVDVENDFEPEYRVPNDKRQVVKELKEVAARSKEIFLATDPDREGEAIAWHVREAAEMDPDITQRVVFHEITESAIKEAFEHPRAIDMDRVDAQQARRILDRLVGYKLSPLLWRKVRGRLSAGRVQSVAVKLVVDREREIEQFDSLEYWTVDAELSQHVYRDKEARPYFVAKLFKFNGEDPVLNSEEDVNPHVAALESAAWDVGEVKLGSRIRRPAAPFTTSTLQQEASRHLKFGTRKTMRIAQQLYEGIDIGAKDSIGLITYMRTDSVNVSAEAQQEARTFIDEHYGTEFRPDELPTYRTKAKAAQEAHEAIRPTSVYRSPKKMKQFLSKDQYRLYRLIWERFVASQMSPALYDTVSADIWAGPADQPSVERPYLFRATGSTLRFSGFLTLYEESSPEDRPQDIDLEHPVPSDLVEGENLDLLQLLPLQHFTQPPPRYSEATLVKALEENGVGRPSTYASIISTIQDRGYVTRESRRLYPTETGRIVNDLLVEHFPDILSVDFTARMESDLDDIVDGKPWVPVIQGFYDIFEEDLEAADKAIPKLNLQKEVEPVGRDCPLCGNPLVYREGRYGRFIGCSTFPTCRFTEQILNKIGVVCPVGGGEIVERRTRKGRIWYSCSRYPECEWTSWKKPVLDTESGCDGLLVQVNADTTECVSCGLKELVQEPAKESTE
ncbi:MAG: type I DNA topoisomerase [Candidatus Promineifilaceae bacterium]